MRAIHALVPLVLCLIASVGQACAEEVRIPLPGGGTLVLPAPDGWRSTHRPGPVPTVALSSQSGASFQVLVSPLVAPDGRLAPATADFLQRYTEEAANAARSQATEKSLPIRSFGSGNVQGNYFSATDRAPKPGEYEFLTQGVVAVRGLPVGFTILSNGNAQAVTEPALRMLAAARRE